MKRLSTVKRRLDEIDSINYGGCGVSALSMFRWLKQNDKLVGDESFTFLYVYYDGSFSKNDAVLNKRSKGKLTSASHVMLYHNGKLHDSEGIGIKELYVKRHEKISEKLLLISLKNGAWNDDFERKEFLPIIEKKLGIDLSDVSLEHN